MKRFLALLLPLTLFATGCACCSTASKSKSQALFNGHDLSGWVVMHGGDWKAETGVLIGSNGRGWSTNPETSGSWLRTEKRYGDFILELEYATNPRGNGGVFVHSALEKNPAFTGHEIQILDDHGREPKKTTTGSLYDVVAPSKNMSKPAGEWNALRIDCQGKRIQVTMNGAPIINYETDRATHGYIGLQCHDTNAVIRFRSIRLTEQ